MREKLNKFDVNNFVMVLMGFSKKDIKDEPLWKQFEEFTKNHIQENTAVPLLEVYTNSSTQVANPSQWITELYFPIKPIASVPSPAKEADSLTTLP